MENTNIKTENAMKTMRVFLIVICVAISLPNLIVAEGGEGISGSICLSSRSGISGLVKDAQNVNGISAAAITITAPGGQSYTTTTLSNGTFFYSLMPASPFTISVVKQGYQPINQTFSINKSCLFKEFSMMSSSSGTLALTDDLTLYANSIVQGPNGYYTLNGNVNINGILFFGGQLIVDKRPFLYHPEVSGNCEYYASNIQGSNVTLKKFGGHFVYYAQGNTLNPKSFSHILDGTIFMGGFNVKLGQMIIAKDGSQVEMRVIAEMPFPVDKILEFVKSKMSSPLDFINTVSFSDIYSKSAGRNSSGSISGLGVNFGLFAIENANFHFNTSTNVFGGGFKIKIPGGQTNKDYAIADTALPDSLAAIPVLIQSPEGITIDSTSLDSLLSSQKFLGSDFFSAGVQVEFVSGAINQLILTLGAKIPLGASGLFITELKGGVDNMVNKDDWRIIASIDVETGLELPVLGSPLKLNDFGVNIHPLNYLKGAGAFEVFGHEVSDGFLEYDGRKRSLSGQANLNLADMIVGNSYLNLRKEEFTGGGEFVIKTPSNLPFIFNWAENIVLSSAQANIDNYNILTQNRYLFLSIAQRYEFGKQGFPWFHYYIGTNYNNLVRIWKGEIAGKQAIQFQVPENCSQFFVIASDTISYLPSPFSLVNPLGNTFDSLNANYHVFNHTAQVMMVIDRPTSGEWTLISPSLTNVRTEFVFLDQPPTALMEHPDTKGKTNPSISISLTDYADTMMVKVFYDTDSLHYDGTLIQEFKVVNNASLEFNWQTTDVPDGEYYIYCLINDNKNAPIAQYAPGSIIVSNSGFTTSPQQLIVSQQGDTMWASWESPTDTDIHYTVVYYKNLSTRSIEQHTVSDTNLAYLLNLKSGQEYNIWCRFVNHSGAMGPESNIESIVFLAPDTSNNPPYFLLTNGFNWRTVVGEPASLLLSAGDADNDSLNFSLFGDTLGILIQGHSLSWTPGLFHRGVHNINVVVSDGKDTDTARIQVIVYTEEQASVKVGFSSVNLYENDIKFVRVFNYFDPRPVMEIVLENLRTGDTIPVSCRKVNDFEYIGQFEVSFIKKSQIPVANGDTIQYSYSWLGQQYTAKAFYDSLPQPFDIVSPDAIYDLDVQKLNNSSLTLRWTATGNDGSSGRAYKYDIRYSDSPILDENDFMLANRILKYPYPSLAGQIDSLVVILDTLPGISNYDSIWFSIKAEDEMQNRGGLSNSSGMEILLPPSDVKATPEGTYHVRVQWNTAKGKGLNHYKVFRRMDDIGYQLLLDSLSDNEYLDNLYNLNDGLYSYAIQAVFDNGLSDTAVSNNVNLDRFVDVMILCQLEDTNEYDNISFSIHALDTIYNQIFSATTNHTGLIILSDVFHSEYIINISKAGYFPYHDTVVIESSNQSLVFTLYDSLKLRTFNGQLRYDNQLETPIIYGVIKVRDNMAKFVDSTMSDTMGNFKLTILPGDYFLEYSLPYVWGGVDSTDVIAVMNHFTDNTWLEGLKLIAADVNQSGFTNAVDALLITKRLTAYDTSFARGNWVYGEQQIKVIPGQNSMLSIKILCTGDVDASYSPVLDSLYICTPQPDQANAGPDQINITGSSTTLQANQPTNGTGVWSLISGTGGAFGDINNPHTVFQGVPGKSYTLTWTISTFCGFSSDTLLLSFSNIQSFVLGEGTLVNTSTGWPTSYGQYYTGQKAQYLILASELLATGAAAGDITALAFHVVTPTPPTASGSAADGSNLKNYTIKISSTSATSLSAFASGLTQVYTTNAYTTTTGWNSHPFDTVFHWDGNSNLLVETCFENYTTGSNYSSNAIVYHSNTSFNSFVQRYSDSGGVCTSSVITGSPFTKRPNILLTIVTSSGSK